MSMEQEHERMMIVCDQVFRVFGRGEIGSRKREREQLSAVIESGIT